ncbi:cupin domain-containing protein [Acerihabitans sp. KWT182]|uniref:Cupin domain-containing protein n=1 Tax=Acerihabitans sp. KWT182 TaxID=3157919 RepID=A0AAU7QFV5_9GAMM
MQVFSLVFGASAEARLDLATEENGQLRIALSAEQRKIFGMLSAEEARDIDKSRKGVLCYQLPDSGISYWQAEPSAGWVEVKLSPFTQNVHHYALLMQTLFPGHNVREHAHNQLNEFFIITKGIARAALDGVEALCPKGTVIVIGRNVWHWWGNAGKENAQNFAVIDPPGVEGALALTGRLRVHGEAWPDNIVRNPETGRILHERYGFLIRQGSADAPA